MFSIVVRADWLYKMFFSVTNERFVAQHLCFMWPGLPLVPMKRVSKKKRSDLLYT